MSYPVHRKFIENAVEVIRNKNDALGLAAGGSWITNEIDEYSDLDLIIVTAERLSDSKDKMLNCALSLGKLLSAFTGEHVGESRLLICLYDNPLLHVDIKFLIPAELYDRVEDPVILWEKEQNLSDIINSTKSDWPGPDYQWIEDRFWTWVHYTVLKLGRGEIFEALEFLSFIRQNVIAPLIQVKNGNLPRGFRKIEFNCSPDDVKRLSATLPVYKQDEIFDSLYNIIIIYKDLREAIFPGSVLINNEAEQRVIEYYNEVKMARKK